MIYKKQEIVTESAGAGLIALLAGIGILAAATQISCGVMRHKSKKIKEIVQNLPNKESKYRMFRGYKISETTPEAITSKYKLDDKAKDSIKYDSISLCLMKVGDKDIAYYIYNPGYGYGYLKSYECAIIDKKYNTPEAKEFIEAAFESKMGIAGDSLKSILSRYKPKLVNHTKSWDFTSKNGIDVTKHTTIDCTEEECKRYENQFKDLVSKLEHFVSSKAQKFKIDTEKNVYILDADRSDKTTYIGIDISDVWFDDDAKWDEFSSVMEKATDEFAKINKFDSTRYDGKIDDDKKLFIIDSMWEDDSYVFVLKYKKVPHVVNECGMFNEAKFI